MAEHETSPSAALELGAHWRRLVDGWVARSDFQTDADANTVTLEFDAPEAERRVTVRFTATKRLLVAFMTDGRYLRPDQLAQAAAAANAWNIEQLNPMLSVWDVRGPHPCLAGTNTLPLGCRMTPLDFSALADDWIDQARQLFTKCHQVFGL